MVRGGTALALATSVIRAPLLVAIVLTACSPGLPRPKTGPVPKDAMFEIPYPPPAARVETIGRPWWAASIRTLGRPS